MHMVSFCIGGAPSDEPCAQTGITNNWVTLQQLECTVYRAALIARFGVPPEDARLAIRTHSHDFGSYAQVETVFDRDDADSLAWFEQVEDGLSTWLEANFTAPVEYDDRAKERVGSRRDADDVITAALMTSQQIVNSGHATDREHYAVRAPTQRAPPKRQAACWRPQQSGADSGSKRKVSGRGVSNKEP